MNTMGIGVPFAGAPLKDRVRTGKKLKGICYRFYVLVNKYVQLKEGE
jgi:hypothetical protein